MATTNGLMSGALTSNPYLDAERQYREIHEAMLRQQNYAQAAALNGMVQQGYVEMPQPAEQPNPVLLLLDSPPS